MVEVSKLESATCEIGRCQVEVETGRQSRGLIIRQERRVADKGDKGKQVAEAISQGEERR